MSASATRIHMKRKWKPLRTGGEISNLNSSLAQLSCLAVVNASPISNRPSTSTGKSSNVVAPWEEEAMD